MTKPVSPVPASFPDIEALARRFHPMNVWARVRGRLPATINEGRALDAFLGLYGEALDRRRLKRGADQIDLPDSGEAISLSPTFVAGGHPGLRVTYKGQRVESIFPVDKATRDSYLWAWWAWGVNPALQAASTQNYLRRLGTIADLEEISALLTPIATPALALTGDWAADFNRVFAAVEANWRQGDSGNTFQTLYLILRTFGVQAQDRPIRFMYTVSRKNESKDFQTPEAVIEEWEIRTPDADTVKKWEAALDPYASYTAYKADMPQWWWDLNRQPVLEETISVPQWTKKVENDLEQIRKINKLRRGTNAYEAFLINALPSVVYSLRVLINQNMKEKVDANEAKVNKWLEKAAVAERKLDESIEQVQKAAATRAAFARFYGAPVPPAPDVSGYETLLRALIDTRISIVSQQSNDELPWHTARMALQAVPEIRAVWDKVQWPAEIGS